MYAPGASGEAGGQDTSWDREAVGLGLELEPYSPISAAREEVVLGAYWAHAEGSEEPSLMSLGLDLNPDTH